MEKSVSKLPVAVRNLWPLILMIGLLCALYIAFALVGDFVLNQTFTEALIKVVVVCSLFVFVGNSGIISFGHVSFMLIGAYATAWQTCCPAMRGTFMTGLPDFLLNANYHWTLAVLAGGLLTAVIGFLAGIALMRLSGVAASIGTFAFLMVVHSVYIRWDSWTSGPTAVVGLPIVVTPIVGLIFAVIAMTIAFLYTYSKKGLALSASREDHVAAQADGINVFRQRLFAFVLSAFMSGIAGGLTALFLGLLSVDTFFLDLTIITLSMLVVGGLQSFCGAVIGVVSVSTLLEVLRKLETDFELFGLSLPGNSAQVGLGVAVLLILIFRPSGLTKNREVFWPLKHWEARNFE